MTRRTLIKIGVVLAIATMLYSISGCVTFGDLTPEDHERFEDDYERHQKPRIPEPRP
jgi:hypothetical protein